MRYCWVRELLLSVRYRIVGLLGLHNSRIPCLSKEPFWFSHSDTTLIPLKRMWYSHFWITPVSVIIMYHQTFGNIPGLGKKARLYFTWCCLIKMLTLLKRYPSLVLPAAENYLKLKTLASVIVRVMYSVTWSSHQRSDNTNG